MTRRVRSVLRDRFERHSTMARLSPAEGMPALAETREPDVAIGWPGG